MPRPTSDELTRMGFVPNGETSWDDAIALARRAIYDTDGRGMIGGGRHHLEQRVARALIHHERRIRENAQPK